MIARKLVWLAAEVILAALWVRFGSAVAFALAMALLLIPLVSSLLNLYLRKKIRLNLTAESNLRKGETGDVVLEFENPTRFPAELGCTLTIQNLLNGMTCRKKIRFSGQRMVSAVSNDHCGRLRLTVERVRLYDCFGLMGVPVSCREKCHITVLPDGFETSIILTNTPGALAESEQYSPYRSGQDLTETFQLREYVPGDSPRQIHWKLSGKLDRLIVRDPGLPIVQDVLLFWERTGGGEAPDSVDAQAEAVVSIGRALLEQDVQFRLGWNDVTENRCILHEIRDLDDLIAVLPRLLGARGREAGDSGAALLMQTRPDALCSHMIYVAHTPAPEVPDWQGFGRLTVLTMSQGYNDAVAFDERNYPVQLAQLVI